MAEVAHNSDHRRSQNTDLSARIEDMVLEPLPKQDRLPPMLFLAALVHGILIIGITFTAVLGDDFGEAISLEVTIVADPDPNAQEPDRAAYLAQASQQGTGNTDEQSRPSARAESVVPVDNVGSDAGDRLDESTAANQLADQLLSTQTEQDFIVPDDRRENPLPEESTAANLEAGIELTLPLPQDESDNPFIRDDKPRELVTSVDTKESRIAGYLSRWKTKIETIGIRYFPDEEIAAGFSGSPTLEVTIAASGQLQEVLVRRSSGSKALDQIAIGILRRAAPFDPFPEAVRNEYDQLRFAYKWQFNHLGVQTTAQSN